MKQTILTLGAIGIGCIASIAWAEPVKIDMKAGLWEHSFKLTGDSANQVQAEQAEQIKKSMAEMKKQLANMSPEQRQMVEGMMEQQGIKMSGDGVTFNNDRLQVSKDGTVVKACVTQAQIDKGELPNNDTHCKNTLTQQSKNTVKVTYSCTGDNPSTGVSDYVFDSPGHYTGKSKVTTTINGTQQVYEGEQSGKWLSSDCGDIKPD